MSPNYGTGIVAVLSIVVHLSSGQDNGTGTGISIMNSTDGHLVIREGSAWKPLALPFTNVPTLKVLCRSLGLQFDDVKRLENHQQPTLDSGTVFMNINCSGNETSIDECQIAAQESLNSNSSLVKLHCRGPLSFSLTGGGDRDGLVLVRHNDKLVPVCVSGTDIITQPFAATVCKRLGFNVSHPLVMYPYKYTPDGREITQALKLELHCHGEDCELHTTNTDEYCISSYGILYLYLAAVNCVEQSHKYRLQDTIQGGSRAIGRLEVWANNTWGPVCETVGGQMFAEYACSAMGLPSAGAQSYRDLYNGGEFSHGSLAMNYCGLDDQRECVFNTYGKPCDDEQYLGVSCAGATEGEVRLYGTRSGLHSGQVQIYHNGSWSGVGVESSRSSGHKEAVAVCRTLNLSTNGVEFSQTRHNFSLLWLDNIYCNGDESTLLHCNGASLDRIENKTRGRALSVSCGTRDNALRLEDNGLLMMKQSGLWGTVCANSINNLDAAVICKALNKPYTLASRTTGSNEPKRTRTVWTQNFKCKSINDNWRDCLGSNYAPSLRSCNHDNDVYITCAEIDNSKLAYRLVNGPKPNIGYLEMFVNNTWGYVCKTGMTEREAKVVCRSMNFPTEHPKVFTYKFLGLLSPFHNNKLWISSLRCTGSEASVLDCAHSYPGDGYCYGNKGQVAVYCGREDASDDLSLRIAGEAGATSGRLEVKLFGEWGTICNTKFDDDDARTACRQMDLPNLFAEVADRSSYAPGTGRIWMTNISCGGYESKLERCSFPPVGNTNCSHSQDVGVRCTDKYSPLSSNSGVIIGATLGCTAFVLICGVVILVILLRVRKTQTITPPVVQYVVPRQTVPPSAEAPPPYPGYPSQGVEAPLVKKQ